MRGFQVNGYWQEQLAGPDGTVFAKGIEEQFRMHWEPLKKVPEVQVIRTH